MPSIDDRLQRLIHAASPDEAVDILDAALRHAADDEVDSLAHTLLDLDTDDAWVAVMRRWRRLAPAVRVRVTQHAARLDRRLRLLLGLGKRTSHEQALDVIAAAGGARHLATLVHLLDNPVESIRRRAASAFRSCVDDLVDNPRHPGLPVRHRARIESRLLEALAVPRDDRHEPLFLLTAILADHAGPTLAAELNDSDSPAAFALQRVCANIDQPDARRRLIRWMGRPGLGRRPVRRLAGLSGSEAFSDFLADGHLLRNPKRRPMLRTADRPVRCAPTIDDLPRMRVESLRHVPALLRNLKLSTPTRIERLTELMVAPDPRTRLLAVCELQRERHDAAQTALASFARDAHAGVATLAGAAICQRARPSTPVADRFARHDIDTPASRYVQTAAWSRDIEAFLFAAPEAPVQLRIAAAHTLMNAEPERFVACVRGLLVEPAGPHALAAMEIVRRLELTGRVEGSLIDLMRGGDPKLASAAALTLGDDQVDDRLDVLEEAIKHDDPRVAANAVEAIDHARPTETPRIVEIMAPICESQRNRARANAIRSLVRRDPDEGAPQLHLMLDDDDPRHRLSAIWTARRARATPMIAHLRALSERDAHVDVRRRARSAMTALEVIRGPVRPAAVVGVDA